MADSPIGGEEMAPTQQGATKGNENYPRSSTVTNLSLREGRPACGARRPNRRQHYGNGDGSRSADSMHTGKEIVPESGHQQLGGELPAQ